MTVEAFAQRSRLERGQLIGPRIFTTGMVLFGAGWPGIHHEIVDMQQARESLVRIRDEGGPYMLAYKNYQLPSRFVPSIIIRLSRLTHPQCVTTASSAGFARDGLDVRARGRRQLGLGFDLPH